MTTNNSNKIYFIIIQGNIPMKAMWSKAKEVETRESKWRWKGKSGDFSTNVMKAQQCAVSQGGG